MRYFADKLMMVIAVLSITSCNTITGNRENLVKNGDAEDNASIKEWHKNLSWNNDDKVDGEGCFYGKKRNIWAFSPGFIEVDTAKEYRLSAWLKAVGKAKSTCYIGLAMYTGNKRSIQRPYVTVEKGTITELAAAVKAGDKVLKIKDCSKWNVGKIRSTQVAFSVNEDYSDLPNFNVSNLAVKLRKKANIYELTLRSPVKRDYPAGTRIRQHYAGGGYQYCAASNKIAPSRWKKYSAVVRGIAKYGAPDTQFWPGTRYVRIVVIINYKAKKGSDTQTLFDEVSFSELDEK